ncbi:ATP-grasp domain-containing protein [Nakamurella leprariae]|uniref:ATP-grasp domain-containing protein n=1 Tax=Nakamurella leprariae TaxID=2803911 RepID=A0A939C1Z5_9ACTN|nr:ATP-grasp domain-containing protein [Nakamurella leprariae]MBM9467622.1 ATP-grasp domain-containing protein [Nakamurella leprariae]
MLVTGAGGAAAVAILRSLRGHYRLAAADINPVAVGLYLVEPDQRWLLPRGDDPTFVPALLDAAQRSGADLVVPTVDVESPRIATARDEFTARGIRLLLESPETLAVCLDKFELMRRCAEHVAVPRTVLWTGGTEDADVAALAAPFVIKPRAGAGGRGVAVLADVSALASYPRDGQWIVQELLPGEEYSIDVLARPDGHVVAAVPRRRDLVDSGIAIAGRTVADDALVRYGTDAARAVGATGVVNVQVRRAVDGTPKLLEINPRFPGTMPLTIASGVDMPVLAVQAALGGELPDHLPFREVAVVRHWEDVIVPVDQYGEIRSAAAASAAPSEPTVVGG